MFIFFSLLYILMFEFFVFFFSSRRRHTRFDCDWSSDVCSSDLHEPGGVRVAGMGRDGKAEFRRADRGQLMRIGAAILRPEDTVMVLTPDDLRVRRAMRQPVDVLRDRIAALLR